MLCYEYEDPQELVQMKADGVDITQNEKVLAVFTWRGCESAFNSNAYLHALNHAFLLD